jgi:hypothetical protein
MDMRLKYTAIAQRYSHKPFSFGGTDWSRILLPDGITIGSDNVLVGESETVEGEPATLTSSFILPDTWNGEIIDGNVFCNIKAGVNAPNHGYTYISDIDIEIKKIDSSGTETSLSGVVAILDGGTSSGPLSQPAEESGYIYGRFFGWIPIDSAEIKSDEHILVTVSITVNGTRSDTLNTAKLVYSADTEDTYFIFPLV